MTAFDKAWGVTKFRVLDKPSDEGKCDGIESREGCNGDGSLGDGGGYECSVCSESFCEDCANVGHIPEEDKGLADAALDFANQPGSIYENMCSECELELLNEHIPEFKAHLKDVEDEMNERRIEERNEMDDFERRVDEQDFFGDNRGETLFDDTSPHLHSKFNPDWQDKMKSKDSFESAWGIAKAADWDTSFNFKEDREKANWSQEDIDRLNARNDKAREALRNRTPLPTRSNENALDRALSRARRENAKPKPKMRITRPDDWE